jgi:hypothetical protein
MQRFNNKTFTMLEHSVIIVCLNMKKETVEEGMVVTKPRKVITVGHSKAVTLPKKWLDVQRWLGKEVIEMASIGNSAVIFCSPEDVLKWKNIIRKIEDQSRARPRKKLMRNNDCEKLDVEVGKLPHPTSVSTHKLTIVSSRS